MGSQPSPSWLDIKRQYIYNQMIKSMHRFPATQKDHIASQKMNDHIHMESTIAGSMNAPLTDY